MERPLKLFLCQHILYEQINKNPPNGAKINKAAAKSGVNHAELFNPKAWFMVCGGFMPCDFFAFWKEKMLT